MGFGLPAAIGAQVACPDKTVVNIAGDGSIQMNIQEMATAVQFSLPVKVVILNNGYLGMVRQWQELFYEKRYSWTNMEHAPDFVKLAEAFGAEGLRATKPDEVETVLAKGLASPRTVIMEFIVEKEESAITVPKLAVALSEVEEECWVREELVRCRVLLQRLLELADIVVRACAIGVWSRCITVTLRRRGVLGVCRG